MHWAVMMIKDCKLLTELQHAHMNTRTEKVCTTKSLKNIKKMINFNDYTNENKTEHI